MRLILSQYLRTLKERDEFDRLLPDILMSMGYVPVSKPQTGVRQYGVDLAAVGVSPDDGAKELLCLVIKRGDIGRNEWDTGPQSVRQSLNEVLDVYLNTHIEPSHESLKKVVVLATTGDLKQEVQINWDSYAQEHSGRATLKFWGGDQISTFIKQYMLNEHIFDEEDRLDLRKALALAGELDYDQKHLHRLFRRVLKLADDGTLVTKTKRGKDLVKALRVVSLSAQVFARWSEDEGNIKHALLAMERALLWSWHRIQLEPVKKRGQYLGEFGQLLWYSYFGTARRYIEKLQPYCYVKDGFSGYSSDSAELSLVVLEQIGILSSIGLACILVAPPTKTQEGMFENSQVVADALSAVLENNAVSGSPRFDSNVIDIILGFILLVLTGRVLDAEKWLGQLVKRIDYAYKVKRDFPVCTDSIDDLVALDVFGEEGLRAKLMKMSWLLPTLAGWAVIFGRDDLYELVTKNVKNEYPEVCLQLWHPTAQDIPKHLYWGQAQYHCGESEAPILLPETAGDYRAQMEALLKSVRHNVLATSTAGLAGIVALDIIAYRHFRTPVAPFFWFQFLRLRDPLKEESVDPAFNTAMALDTDSSLPADQQSMGKTRKRGKAKKPS